MAELDPKAKAALAGPERPAEPHPKTPKRSTIAIDDDLHRCIADIDAMSDSIVNLELRMANAEDQIDRKRHSPLLEGLDDLNRRLNRLSDRINDLDQRFNS